MKKTLSSLKSLSSALLISRYILGLGQCGRCCFCAACPNRKMYVEIKSPNEAIRCVENYWLHNFFPQQLFELSFLENRCFSYYLEGFKILKICFVFYRVPQLNGICRKRQWRWLLLWLKRSKILQKDYSQNVHRSRIFLLWMQFTNPCGLLFTFWKR